MEENKMLKQFSKMGTGMLLAAVLVVMPVMVGCTASDTAMNVLNEITTASSFICPIVILANPASGAACTSAQSVFADGNKAVQQAYSDFEKADAANQPAKLATFQAMLSTLRTDLLSLTQAAQVKNVAHQQAIDGIISGILDMVSQVAGFAGQVQAGGGTTAAMYELLGHEAWGGGGTNVTVSKQIKMLHSAKYFKKELKAHLTHKTGDAVLDATLAGFAKQLK
jgi:hypothetical protein